MGDSASTAPPICSTISAAVTVASRITVDTISPMVRIWRPTAAVRSWSSRSWASSSASTSGSAARPPPPSGRAVARLAFGGLRDEGPVFVAFFLPARFEVYRSVR